MGELAVFSPASVIAEVELQAATKFHELTSFGLNVEAHARGMDRNGDLGPGNRLTGSSGSSGATLKPVSCVEYDHTEAREMPYSVLRGRDWPNPWLSASFNR